MSPDARETVTWLGHATALIEIGDMRLITDPCLRKHVGPLTRIAPPLSPGAVDGVDAVLLSHLHADHLDLPSLARIRGVAEVIAPRGAGDWLVRRGIGPVRELEAGQRARVGTVELVATRANHGGRRRPFAPQVEPLGFVVRGAGSVYFAGDTDLFPEMRELRDSIDVALLPIWGWGPALGPGHLDPERAATAAAVIAPRVAVPIHWGTFALPRPFRRRADPLEPAREFAARARERAPGVEVRVLQPGERTAITRMG